MINYVGLNAHAAEGSIKNTSKPRNATCTGMICDITESRVAKEVYGYYL